MSTSTCRQELQHFVAVMEGYITNQLFHLSWRELENRLKEVMKHSVRTHTRVHTYIRKHDDMLRMPVWGKCLNSTIIDPQNCPALIYVHMCVLLVGVQVKSLDELIQCHNKFLDNIMFR